MEQIIIRLIPKEIPVHPCNKRLLHMVYTEQWSVFVSNRKFTCWHTLLVAICRGHDIDQMDGINKIVKHNILSSEYRRVIGRALNSM